VSYELAHDSLVLPISDEASKRHEREARRKAEALAEQEREQNRQMALKMRALEREAEARAEAEEAKEAMFKAERKAKRMTYLAAFSILLFFSMAFLYFIIQGKVETKRSEIKFDSLTIVKDSLEFEVQKVELSKDSLTEVRQETSPRPEAQDSSASPAPHSRTLAEKKMDTYNKWKKRIAADFTSFSEDLGASSYIANLERLHKSIHFLEKMNIPEKKEEISRLKMQELVLLHEKITQLYAQKNDMSQQIQQAVGLADNRMQSITRLENLKAETLLRLDILTPEMPLLALGKNKYPEEGLYEVGKAYELLAELDEKRVLVFFLEKPDGSFATCYLALQNPKQVYYELQSRMKKTPKAWPPEDRKPVLLLGGELCPQPKVVPGKIYLKCSPAY